MPEPTSDRRMLRIVADKAIPFLRGVLEPYAEVHYMDGTDITNHSVLTADALLIRTRTKVNERLLLGSSVKFIGTATIGYDHIDTAWCEENKVTWANAPGCNADSVRQYMASALCTLSKNRNINLHGTTLGIVGVGHVGKKIHQLALSLGMKVLLNDPPRARSEGDAGFISLPFLLENSDIVTLHVPLNREGEDKTLRMIGHEQLSLMKKDSFVINTSRGEVLDESALKSALKSGRLAGSVLDVWDNEPFIDRELLELVTIATPHIAGYSAEGKANGTAMVVQALANFFGLPPERWYPAVLPQPGNPMIALDTAGKTVEEAINEAVLHTYSVMSDDAMLRQSPGSFENLRSGYPPRREFPAYQIRLTGHDPKIRAALENLGLIFAGN